MAFSRPKDGRQSHRQVSLHQKASGLEIPREALQKQPMLYENLECQRKCPVEVALHILPHEPRQRKQRRCRGWRAEGEVAHVAEAKAQVALQHEHSRRVQIAVVGAAGTAARLAEEQDLRRTPREIRRAALLKRVPGHVNVEPA